MTVVDKGVRDVAAAAATDVSVSGRLDSLEARVAENAVRVGVLEEANERLRSENAWMRSVIEVFRAAGNIMGMADLLRPPAPHP